MSVCFQDFLLTELFIETMLDWNEGGTRNLILRGNDLSKKVGRRIEDGDIIRITHFLSKHPEVVSLELPYNEIGNCGIFNLMEHIRKNPTVRYLNLIGNEIGEKGIRHIVALAQDFPFYELRLSGNKIGNEGARLLSQLLYLDTPLKVLDISDCHLTMSGVAHILTGLMFNREAANQIEVIDVGRPLQQFYHQMCNAHAAEFFGQVLNHNSNLKEFHAQQYQLDFRDMEIILDGLMRNKWLQLLDLNNNNIGDDGVGFLCTYLRTGPPLSGLMIGANKFGDDGARSLSFTLPFTNIKLLDISNNHIGDDGIIAIFQTIRKMVPMKKLFLWGNRLTEKSLSIIKIFLQDGIMDGNELDILLYDSNGLQVAQNSHVNMYTHRFYCVSDYGHPPMKKITKNPPPPEKEPDIIFKYHTDEKEHGMPVYGS